MPQAVFTIAARDPGSLARYGRLRTAHGEVETPLFMPVATRATVRGVSPRELREAGATVILANAYHLFLRPGPALVERLGGLHAFMGWSGPILTDSGGYQVMSLAPLRRVTDDGVEFRSHIDGARHFLRPEDVVQVQVQLGSDILMPLDECVRADAPRREIERAMRRTTEWARRSRALRLPEGRLLFGIVQGGLDRELRREHAAQLAALDFPGYAVGGLSVGEERERTREVAEWTAAGLPPERPRYLMGVGLPQDLLRFIAQGYDMFDCVLPTRNGRTGTYFTRDGRCNIRLARYRDDPRPVDPECGCYACTTFTRAYLRHLAVSNEMLAAQMATVHNLTFYLGLLEEARRRIRAGDYASWAAAMAERIERGEGG